MTTDDSNDVAYGIRLAIIYALVWFVDLLDASTLNVALPHIANSFGVAPTAAEWAILGFLLAMTIGISISGWLGDNFGVRKIFLIGQFFYLLSSIACGLSLELWQLILFRVFQGFSGGILIPLGMATLLRTMPTKYWAKTSTCMNMVSLTAPALGPLFAGYVTGLLGWRWLFFIKLPLSFACFVLSLCWVKKSPLDCRTLFDWRGFILSSFALTFILWVFSEAGNPSVNNTLLIVTLVIGMILGAFFLRSQKTAKSPLLPLSLFKLKPFAYGNIVQSAANIIFLGANFIIALYLQNGLHLSIIETGWVMSAITPGMFIVMPFIAKYYNRLGPLPFMIPGLILLGACGFAFIFITPETSLWIIALVIFLEGSASSLVQTPNVMAIFSHIPHKLKGVGSSLYSIFKQLSASFGVALSAMLLSVGGFISTKTIFPYHLTFFALGLIPLLALFFCHGISNKKDVAKTEGDHLLSESDYGTE
jgi:EmrB/QacA subfamily drug resistance transporter